MKKLVLYISFALLIFSSVCNTEQSFTFDNFKPHHIVFIQRLEGFKNTAYHDAKGYLTIGIGHLIKPSERYLKTATLTDKEVFSLFEEDLEVCKTTIAESVTAQLTEFQYDALYSFCFNIGADRFRSSLVVKKLNRNDYVGAANAMLLWNKPAVLEQRRKVERELFLTGRKA